MIVQVVYIEEGTIESQTAKHEKSIEGYCNPHHGIEGNVSRRNRVDCPEQICQREQNGNEPI